MITNLKIINKSKFIYIFFILFIFFSKIIYSSENRIIFKINDIAFTLFDLEKRLEYLDFVGENNNINKEIVIEDFISANLFYEYYKNLNIKNNYEKKIIEIYQNILSTNKLNNKKYNYNIDEENILNNIKIDFTRKIVLENILNSSINNFNTSIEEIDLLYNLNIKYINFDTNDFDKLKNKINSLKVINFKSVEKFLNENNLEYFTKEEEIIDITKINKQVRENIISNNKFFLIEKNNKVSFIFIEKEFETFDGIIAELYSVKSEIELNDDYLKCENLKQLIDNNIINKEYKFKDLNNELKTNLLNINDFVKYSNNNEIIYVVLCNIKFDKEILKNLNLNKLINENINEIEKKFIKKYSKTYNLIRIND